MLSCRIALIRSKRGLSKMMTLNGMTVDATFVHSLAYFLSRSRFLINRFNWKPMKLSSIPHNWPIPWCFFFLFHFIISKRCIQSELWIENEITVANNWFGSLLMVYFFSSICAIHFIVAFLSIVRHSNVETLVTECIVQVLEIIFGRMKEEKKYKKLIMSCEFWTHSKETMNVLIFVKLSIIQLAHANSNEYVK